MDNMALLAHSVFAWVFLGRGSPKIIQNWAVLDDPTVVGESKILGYHNVHVRYLI